VAHRDLVCDLLGTVARDGDELLVTTVMETDSKSKSRKIFLHSTII